MWQENYNFHAVLILAKVSCDYWVFYQKTTQNVVWSHSILQYTYIYEKQTKLLNTRIFVYESHTVYF